MPNQQINKTDLLLLDFHYINYEFCKEQQFSNEKISTFLAIMDFLLHYMLDKQQLPEEGFKILKRILEKHSLQRPPFQILIFDQKDIQLINQFVLKTYFRHYSLYEFSFKPRMELILKNEPFLNNQFNADLCQLDQMVPVDQEESERLKVYLGVYNMQLGDGNLDNDPLSHMGNDSQLTLNNNQYKQEDENYQQNEENEEEQVDWQKVGKVYNGDEDIEQVLEREMNRMKQVLEKRIVVQDIEIEEKHIANKGKKK